MTEPTNPLIRRGADFIESQVDGETVLMHLTTGRVYALAGPAAASWAAFAEPVTLDTAVARLQEQFQVDAAECAADLRTFVAEMCNLGFLVIG